MMKVVYNNSDCEFHISEKAEDWLIKRGINGKTLCGMRYGEDFKLRSHPLFVKCVETLGDEAGYLYFGAKSDLKVREISGHRYFIIKFNCVETVYDETDFSWIEGYREE